MKLSEIVTSLELSLKLKALNIEQESLFYWIVNENYSEEPEVIYAPTDYIINSKGELEWPRNFPEDCYSAYTASELLELLPCSINSWGLCTDATSILTNEGIKNLYHITYADYDKKLMNEISDINICNMLAKMLIYLIEEKLIEV